MPFSEVLRNRTDLLLFAEFLYDQHADENLEFWICVELYRLLPSSAERVHAARSIYNKFLTCFSPREINVEGELRDKVQARMENFLIDSYLFSDVQYSIFQLLEYDCYPRFKALKLKPSQRVSGRFAPPNKLSRSERFASGKHPALSFEPEVLQYLDSLEKNPKSSTRHLLPKSVRKLLFHTEDQSLTRSKSAMNYHPKKHLQLISRRRSSTFEEISFDLKEIVPTADHEVKCGTHRLSVRLGSQKRFSQEIDPDCVVRTPQKLRRVSSSTKSLQLWTRSDIHKASSAPAGKQFMDTKPQTN